MQSKHLANALLITAFFAFPLYLMSRSGGAPNGRSGGNFPGESSCTNSSCHDDGVPNEGPGTLSISINGTPADQYVYTPGETVPLAVRLSDPQAVRVGFQLTARTGDGCGPGGTLAPGEAQVSVRSGPCGSNTVQWSTHTFPKSGGDNTFTTTWTAPADGAGPVTFGVAGHGANGDGTSRGDNVYHLEAVSQPMAGTGGPTPEISSGGIVLATLTPIVTTGTANAIATAFGTDFAPEGTFRVVPDVDPDGTVSTTLADTCIEVGGKRSPMFAVLPTQINFQVSDQVGLGPAPVSVIRGCGTGNEQASPIENFDVAAAQPGFFLFVAARPQVAATHQDGVNAVGPSDLILGVTTPAAPGEFVSLWGTGFGVTSPLTSAGEITQVSDPSAPLRRLATANVRVIIGGIEVPTGEIFYIGGAPCCAGLYQLVVKIPDNAPDGELPVELIIDGVSSPEGPFVAVRTPE